MAANFAENLKLLHTLRNLIPDYDGDQATLSDFINACEYVHEQIDENLNPGFLLVVKNKLVGKAKHFISSRNLNTFESIRQLLIGHFGDCRDTESLLRDLTACTQKSGETPRVFVQRIEDLLTKLRNAVSLDGDLEDGIRETLNNSHEKIALKTLLAGLNDPIGTIIRSQRPNTIDEAIHFIIEEENIHYLKNRNSSRDYKQSQRVIPRSNFNNPEVRRDTTKVCNYCKNKGHVISECRKRMYNQNRSNFNRIPGGANTTPAAGSISGTFNNSHNTHAVPNNYNRPTVIQGNHAVHHLNGELGVGRAGATPGTEGPQSDTFQSQNLSF